VFARRVLMPLALLLGICTSSQPSSVRADEPVSEPAPLPASATTDHAAALTAAPPPPEAAVIPAPTASEPPLAPQPLPGIAPDEHGATPPALPPASATATVPATPGEVAPPQAGPTNEAVEVAPRKKREPMNSYAFGLKIGVARVGTGTVSNPTYVKGAATLPPDQLAKYGLVDSGGCDPIDKTCHTAARRGFHLAVPIQIGGSGVGFQVEPFLTIASAGNAYGVYMGPTFQFHVADPVYVGFGLGLQAAWVKSDPWKYAGDVYGRIPLNATYYVTDGLGLVVEFGFGAGASAYIGEVKDIINPTTGNRIARKSDVTFGFGKIWDLSFGVRFP